MAWSACCSRNSFTARGASRRIIPTIAPEARLREVSDHRVRRASRARPGPPIRAPTERHMPQPKTSPSRYPFIYLASQSPRRQELLQQLGVRFELLLPRPDEDAEALEAELPGERARDYVQRVCIAKAHAARARLVAGRPAARPILGADTTLTIDQ